MDQTETPTSIDRSIAIDAPAQVVWAIISVPGWWVNDGVITEHRIEDLGNNRHRVHDEVHGAFVISTVELDEPRYAAFRWHPTDPEDPSTLTELWITERPGGVELRVKESDFDAIPADKLHSFIADNTEGWETELAAAKTAAEPPA